MKMIIIWMMKRKKEKNQNDNINKIETYFQVLTL